MITPKKVTILKIVGIIFVLIAFGRIYVALFYYKDYGKKEIFQHYKESFELVKDFFLELTPDDEGYDPIGYSVFFYEEKGFVLYHAPEKWGMKEQIALNHISEIFTQKWNEAYIRVTSTRISFEGLGNERIVFSLDGNSPKYFQHLGDGVEFRVEKLDDNWFYLRNTAR